jgi:hypothetical protein
VNRDRPGAFLGMGAFNLVRADAYRACGGYAALRLTVLDDVKLGLLLRRAGKRTRGFIGGDDTECHWGTTVRSMIAVMEKNYFAAVDYRTFLACGACIPLGMWIMSVAGLFSGTVAGVTACLAIMSLALPAAVLARRLRWPILPALLAPWMLPMLFIALFNSMLVTLHQGGIRWRGSFYPLETLRRFNVR